MGNQFLNSGKDPGACHPNENEGNFIIFAATRIKKTLLPQGTSANHYGSYESVLQNSVKGILAIASCTVVYVGGATVADAEGSSGAGSTWDME